MSRLQIFQVDAFASRVFRGNPAAVVPLERWLPDSVLQSIALENNLAETAFFIPLGLGHYHLRWFTPAIEIELCGHATLASAYVVFQHLEPVLQKVRFESQLSPLEVSRETGEQGELLTLNFPAFPLTPVTAPIGLLEALGIEATSVLETLTARNSVYCVLEHEQQVQNLKPNMALLEQFELHGVVVTARGQSCDFASRYFAPKIGIPEDPVTGGIHTSLIPYWAEKLGKLELHARQVSARSGDLWCKLVGDRVLIAGTVVPYLEGFIEVPDSLE
jgi:PhzF family phenazine biosynthesis protein